MAYIKLAFLCILLSGTMPIKAYASKPDMHKHIASCFRIIDGQITDIELDIFQGFKSDLKTPTGFGFAIEKLLNADGSRTKVVFPLELTDKKTEIAITAYLHNDSSKVIAKFIMPKKEEFELEFRIFRLFKRKFTCLSDAF